MPDRLSDNELRQVSGGGKIASEEAEEITRMIETIGHKLEEWEKPSIDRQSISLRDNLVRHGLQSEVPDPTITRTIDLKDLPEIIKTGK